MASQSISFINFTVIVFLLLPHLSALDDSNLPSPTISFRMENWKRDFRAGESAAIEVNVLKDFKTKEDRQSFNPSISMNGVTGNSNLITGLWFDINNWKIFFIPIMVGKFYVLIDEPRFRVSYAAISYIVTPGPIYEPGGIVSWMSQVHDFVAGTKTAVLILPKDAFGNNVTRETEGQNIYNFEVSATSSNGSAVNLLDVSNKGWNEFGYVCIEFVTVTAGHQFIHIKHKNNSLIGSPLPLTVHHGALDVANCLAHWRTQTKLFQLFSTMETFISQRDKFGNLIPGLYEFDIEIVEKGTNLSLPIGDLQYKEVSPGIQSYSFKLVKPGDFNLIISDKNKKMIMNMPYEFNIYIGYCDDKQSVVNGSGLNDSVAGETSYFQIILKDAYQYPAPVELEMIQVEITLPSLSLSVDPWIYPNDFVNGTQPTGMLSDGAFGPKGMTYVPSVFLYDYNQETKTNDYDVVFEAKRSGTYEIRIFCGNIPLNGGRPFLKVVGAGQVDLSKSGIIKCDKNASSNIVNRLTVQLVDYYYNPILLQASRLNLSLATKPGSTYMACIFEDNYDGTYSGSYVAFSPGYYELCISYERKRVLPWPFGVNVISQHRFPRVTSDSVNVWEDQSTAFNPIDNDWILSKDKSRATISQFQVPSHGSLLQYGNLLRYTPYKGFYGYDRFLYTVSDNGNLGTGPVEIHVLTNPPQFVSYPKQLHAVEDTLSPQFSGFPSFEIRYSDPLENISLMLTAQNGTPFLSPLKMQLWDPMWNELSVSNEGAGRDDCLYITGRVEVINFALKSLQYKGNGNFSGDDIITITTINIYGEGHLDVPIYVEPVNDPPFINAPKFIILEYEKENKGFLIFDRQRDKFNFSIGDPDHRSFSGKETTFQVMFSVEVSSGTFSAKLPAQLISSTEVKFKRSKQWQPLQTFVEISKRFTVNKVKGIRFRGTINDCNTLLHQLLYYGDNHDGVLKLTVNDMGWYGCYPDCSEMMSVPLISEATVNLITRTPMNSLVAHSLGSLIVIETILLSLLAVTLMFFTCKCVIVLLREKKKQAEPQNLQPNELKNSHEQMSSAVSTENTIQLTGDHSSSFRQSEQPSNLPKPAEETNVAEVATMII